MIDNLGNDLKKAEKLASERTQLLSRIEYLQSEQNKAARSNGSIRHEDGGFAEIRAGEERIIQIDRELVDVGSEIRVDASLAERDAKRKKAADEKKQRDIEENSWRDEDLNYRGQR